MGSFLHSFMKSMISTSAMLFPIGKLWDMFPWPSFISLKPVSKFI